MRSTKRPSGFESNRQAGIAIDAALAQTISEAIKYLKAKEPGFTGFALCTDSNVSTLYAVATTDPMDTVDWALPNEWKVRIPPTREAFTRIGDELRAKLSHTRKVVQHVNQAFGLLVSTLAECRTTNQIGAGVLLLVVDTDPSSLTDRLCTAAAMRLNSDKVFRHWHLGAFGKAPKATR